MLIICLWIPSRSDRIRIEYAGCIQIFRWQKRNRWWNTVKRRNITQLKQTEKNEFRNKLKKIIFLWKNICIMIIIVYVRTYTYSVCFTYYIYRMYSTWYTTHTHSYYLVPRNCMYVRNVRTIQNWTKLSHTNSK